MAGWSRVPPPTPLPLTRSKKPPSSALVTAVGRVVILNGTSSASKSTIVPMFRAARANVGDLWIPIGADDFNSKLPAQWCAAADFQGPYSHDGVRFEPAAVGVQIRVGDVGRRLQAAYHRTVVAVAKMGFNVIVDDVAIDQSDVPDWAGALIGLRVDWVAVRCDALVAQAREQARRDRFPGLALGLSEIVHRYACYNLSTRP
jgi:chloramphenicol 3-O phosphotransferase